MIISYLLPYLCATYAAILALIVFLRSPRTIADWMFSGGMLVLAAENLFLGLTAQSQLLEDIIYWQIWRTVSLALLPGFWTIFSLSYARGNAVDFLGKWRLPLIGAFIVPVLITALFRHNLLETIIDNANEGQWIVRLGWVGLALNFFLLGASIFILMNLERTFRASIGTMRWRIKFMLTGVGLLFTVRLYTSSQALLFHGIAPSFQMLNAAAALVASLLITRSLFRSRRSTLDVYPSQFVIQGSLTIFLAGIYLMFVGIFSKIVSSFGGGTTFAFKSFLGLVALVVLAILLQSDRVRVQIRRFVSRNFQRPLYDYRTMWQRFNEGTASRVEQADLCRTLVRLVADMFEALSVSIWLIDEKRETFILSASTSLSEAQSRKIAPQPGDSNEVIRHFQQHPEPADIEGSASPWATNLRQWHPGEFPNGGHRLCIPLHSHGEMLGLITLGDRIGGAPYSLQDFDMLKCVGDHVAASLLNARLSQKLMQAKELEAFQTMATFFVHDLKNAASTLNLMLKNLPIHFDDPAFREDTLRGISKTVTHINHLVGRLGHLRHELKIQSAPTDLNAVVASALATFENKTEGTLVKELQPLPKIHIDREQILKVITNLILNAKEAAPGASHVSITTQHDKNWVVLSVTDNGCGMTPEFLSNSLFRAFQTTKKSGLGIGMFQSKMIIEAHKGRIAVASKLGIGTTFQVFLPTTEP